MSAPFGAMPTRWDPDTGPARRVAVVLPGSGYSPAHPLLEFGRQALLQHGWTVQQIWWDTPQNHSSDVETTAWVCDQARTAIDAETAAGADQVLIIAKSLGTLAAPVAAALCLDAIWLTPLFGCSTPIAEIGSNAQAGARQLLVGGLADEQWDAELARTLGCDVVDFADATHFMHVPGDVVRTVEIHRDIATAFDTFLTGLDGTS